MFLLRPLRQGEGHVGVPGAGAQLAAPAGDDYVLPAVYHIGGRRGVARRRQCRLPEQAPVAFVEDAEFFIQGRGNEDEAADLSKFLSGDLYVIGGAHIYEAFAPLIDSWIVTEIPETIADADVFMPADYLEGFQLADAEELEDGLVVRRYERMS